jgi:hypothetical protein
MKDDMMKSRSKILNENGKCKCNFNIIHRKNTWGHNSQEEFVIAKEWDRSNVLNMFNRREYLFTKSIQDISTGVEGDLCKSKGRWGRRKIRRENRKLDKWPEKKL